jgi:hypothetical protein
VLSEVLLTGRDLLWLLLLQVLLTMSRHPKHEKDVLQLLKRRIMQACEDEAGGTSSSSSGGSIAGGCSGWMSGLQQVNKCPSIQEMQQGLIKAIRWVTCVWAGLCLAAKHCIC